MADQKVREAIKAAENALAGYKDVLEKVGLPELEMDGLDTGLKSNLADLQTQGRNLGEALGGLNTISQYSRGQASPQLWEQVDSVLKIVSNLEQLWNSLSSSVTSLDSRLGQIQESLKSNVASSTAAINSAKAESKVEIDRVGSKLLGEVRSNVGSEATAAFGALTAISGSMSEGIDVACPDVREKVHISLQGMRGSLGSVSSQLVEARSVLAILQRDGGVMESSATRLSNAAQQGHLAVQDLVSKTSAVLELLVDFPNHVQDATQTLVTVKAAELSKVEQQISSLTALGDEASSKTSSDTGRAFGSALPASGVVDYSQIPKTEQTPRAPQAGSKLS